ncbi:pentapeptide repeat-containing protein [Arcobacter sp. YIC-310]|uniref:pentapeptide repeat-containing protein n=1 Tax=Arcobacter sp. YIC-310 TaxID=3376632 RepID=UPI003C27EB38
MKEVTKETLEEDIFNQIKNIWIKVRLEKCLSINLTNSIEKFDHINSEFRLNLGDPIDYKEKLENIGNIENNSLMNEIEESMKSEFSLDEPLDEILVEVLKDKKIKLKNYIFSLEKFDYIKVLEKLSKVEFIECKFIGRYELINFEEALYDDCIINEIYFKNISEEKRIFNKVLFYNTEIKKIYCEGITFKSRLFKKLKVKNRIDSIELINCDIPIDFILNNENRETENDLLKINYLSFKNSTFLKGTKVKIQFCEIEEANFYNTKFEDLADFYQSVFNNADFERTDFKSISIFSEVVFNCDVDFKYTKFIGKAIFRDTVIKKPYFFDLRNTIFDDDANFLDITSEKRKTDVNTKEKKGKIKDIKVKNRETARIIKSFFDNQNNTIEANKFYKLEMDKRLNELFKLKNRNDNDFFEMLIFLFHKIFSNHSQSWSLCLFWLVSFTFLSSALSLDIYCIVELSVKFENIESIFMRIYSLFYGWIYIILLILFTIFIFGIIDKKWHISALFIFVFIIELIFYFYLTKDYSLYYFSNMINPFSIMTGLHKLSFGILIYKIVIAYLIYQFIISIRQNTRRK